MDGMPVQTTCSGDLLLTGAIVLLIALALLASILPRLLRH